MRRTKNRLRWLEYLFLLAGLIAIDTVIWVNAESTVYQSYEQWKFDQTLSAQDASLAHFITDESGLRRVIGLGTAPRAIPHEGPPVNAERGPEPLRRANRDELIGRLEIPRLDINVMVREGDDGATLSHAVGHIPSTAMPGEFGNVALAAHRDTFFRPLRNIRRNDRIIVSTLKGTYEYAVESTRIVSPSDVSVLKASAPHELTLVTCYPFYYIGSAPRRFVVHATQIAATGQPRRQEIGS